MNMTPPVSRNVSQSGLLKHHLQSVHDALKDDLQGTLPAYIPELAQADVHTFALSITLPDGETVQVGNTAKTFTLQSLSKPFSYLLALQTCGFDAVLQAVGTEPSGDPFNSIRLEDRKSRPDNPMVNAGALVVAQMLLEKHGSSAPSEVQGWFERVLGHPVHLNPQVLQSELQTGHRNRAIVHLMRNLGMVQQDPEEVLTFYLQLCALQVQVKDLSLLGALLAGSGRHPISGQQVVSQEVVRQVLSVMFSCGMYNSAGDWACKVGLPAKSGVSGGLLAVAPGKLGLAVHSPSLNTHGHSHRGVLACQMLAQRLHLHLLDAWNMEGQA
ncbi:glutaminase A [Deinococcus misasensis]|uniref:glutaminase A n=1 Tax=Deinococcus misasensis TaxID=392413 RepID=UPI0006907D04|nr:glutaminase A [Deinococcus misasensis]